MQAGSRFSRRLFLIKCKHKTWSQAGSRSSRNLPITNRKHPKRLHTWTRLTRGLCRFLNSTPPTPKQKQWLRRYPLSMLGWTPGLNSLLWNLSNGKAAPYPNIKRKSVAKFWWYNRIESQIVVSKQHCETFILFVWTKINVYYCGIWMKPYINRLSKMCSIRVTIALDVWMTLRFHLVFSDIGRGMQRNISPKNRRKEQHLRSAL